jgi:hypothetical protein
MPNMAFTPAVDKWIDLLRQVAAIDVQPVVPLTSCSKQDGAAVSNDSASPMSRERLVAIAAATGYN